MDGNSGQSVEIELFRLWLSFYRSVFYAVSQFSARLYPSSRLYDLRRTLKVRHK